MNYVLKSNLIQLNTKLLTNDWSELCMGQFVDIRTDFYTKNVSTVVDVFNNTYNLTGDIEKVLIYIGSMVEESVY